MRADFPILSRTVYNKPLRFLDNGASAQKPQSVLDAVQNSYANEYANVHRGAHYLSGAATEAYEGVREKAAELLNAPGPDNIVFTKNVTESINLVACSWAEAHPVGRRRDRHYRDGAPRQYRAVAIAARPQGDCAQGRAGGG